MRWLHMFSQRSFLLLLVIIIQLFIAQNIFAEAIMDSPVGIWQTIDDKTHQPRSIVQIWQQGNELRGKIIEVYYRPDESAKDVCVKCSGANHNQLILGMTILWGMLKQENEWKSGKILDPKNGNVYSCKMSLSPDGRELNVRGYIGISLLGRTQTWLRQVN